MSKQELGLWGFTSHEKNEEAVWLLAAERRKILAQGVRPGCRPH